MWGGRKTTAIIMYQMTAAQELTMLEGFGLWKYVEIRQNLLIDQYDRLGKKETN